MSLEECKRIADERLKEARARAKVQESERCARGWVDEGVVEMALYAVPIGFPLKGKSWIVAVFSHKHYSISKKPFLKKKLAEKYFEELTQKYGLKEAEG